MIILDTNVLSEALRPKPSAIVGRWMSAQPIQSLFTTTICEAEIFYGLALLPAGRRRAALEKEVDVIFNELLAGRTLPFDSAAARSFAVIAAQRRNIGRPIRDADAQIAAIVASNGAALATRNSADFTDCGIALVNPWHE